MNEGPPPVLVVVGASAGGVEGLRTLVSMLPEDLPAAVLVVLHLSPTTPSVLPEILARAGSLPVTAAVGDEPVRGGRIVVAPPDHHLFVDGSTLRLDRAAKENGHRPSIDRLFRSAADAYGRRCVGVLLSGMLDDGVLGLGDVLGSGGTTFVQSPDEAAFPGMPSAAVRAGVAEQVMPLAELAEALTSEVQRRAKASDPGWAPRPAPPDDPPPHQGTPSGLSCPRCHGELWEESDGPIVRYRCRTGHAFSPEALLDAQEGSLDDALWAAYRALLERADLSRRMARRFRGHGGGERATHLDAAADAATRRADVLFESLIENHVPAAGTHE